MKKTSAILAGILAAFLLLAGCAGTPEATVASGSAPKEQEKTVSAVPPAWEHDVEYELVVLHTNDHHGAIESKDNAGGLAQRATYIQTVRKTNPNVLVLDAGDINTGSAASNMFKAEPDILAYNLMGYDAVAFGNHEFDNSLKELEEQIAKADFAFLAANVKKPDGSYLGKPYIIMDFDGFRVGVFGLTTRRTLTIANPDKNLKFLDEIDTAKQMVAQLRNKEKANVVIALTHIGIPEEAPGHVTSVKLAESVPGIDLIIDGHSHSKLDEPLYVKGTPIVSANEWGKFIGQAALTIKNGKVENLTWSPVAVDSRDMDNFAPDPAMVNLLTPYLKEANDSLSEVVGIAAADFEFGDRLSRKKEIALGDLVSDGTTWFIRSKGVPVDFALQNGGNIRAPIAKGNITKKDIATVLPFDNYIYVLTLKGSDVIALFDFIATIPQGSGGFPQFSKEVRYTVNYDTGKMENLTVNGKPVDPAKTYRIATNDYLAGGGDGYEPLKKSIDTYNTSMTLRDAIVDYVRQLPQPVVPATDGRITIIGGMSL